MRLKQAVILAGGKGTRLKPYTDNVPKPLVQINGNPFLDYLIFSLFEEGISEILLLLGYKSDLIYNRYNEINHKSLKINFSFGSTNDKTGKRIIDAYNMLDNKFLLVYGDNYWPLELKKMINQYRINNTLLMTTVYGNRDGKGEYGFENNIIINDKYIVEGYDKERKDKKANGVDIGYFIVDKRTINPDLCDNISFERDIIPKIVSSNNVSAFITNKRYYYITNEDAMKNFEIISKKENITSIPYYMFTNRKK
jgi:NDP-sugar pyrophosphorylase family protein